MGRGFVGNEIAESHSVRHIVSVHDRTSSSASPFRVFPYFYHRRSLGFFEYSINVQNSCTTNRECVCGTNVAERVSHATDYLFLRPLVLPRVNELPEEILAPRPSSCQQSPPSWFFLPFSIFVHLNFNAEPVVLFLLPSLLFLFLQVFFLFIFKQARLEFARGSNKSVFVSFDF